MGTATHLISSSRTAQGEIRPLRAGIGAFVSGLAVFSTHFLAMQGYEAVDARYDVALTLASFATVFVSIAAATVVALTRPGPLFRGLSAALYLSGVAAMHFLGVAGLVVAGHIQWDPALAALGVGGGVAIATAGAVLLPGRAPGGRLLAAATGCLGVIVLHFVSMSAMTITPAPMVDIGWTMSGDGTALVLTAPAPTPAAAAGPGSRTGGRT